MYHCILQFALTALFLQNANSAPEEDLIKDLPGLSFTPDFKQYSGYLQGDTKNHLHYWLVESSNSSEKDPIVFWITTGIIYYSSLYGLLEENGPFRVEKDGKTLIRNPHSWNKVATLVYLEVPVATGFSYSDGGLQPSGDNKTVQDIHLALKDFFKKFPEYSKNDLYIAGQDYAGIYAPLLASQLENDGDIKITGFLFGNGVFDLGLDFNAQMYYMYYHGILSTREWEKIFHLCCQDNPLQCEFLGTKNRTCADEVYRLLMTYIEKLTLNQLNIDSDEPAYPGQSVRSKSMMLQWRKDLMSHMKMEKSFQSMDTPDHAYVTYLNLPEVRKALHIPDGVQNWTFPSAFTDYSFDYLSVIPEISKALQNKSMMLQWRKDLMSHMKMEKSFQSMDTPDHAYVTYLNLPEVRKALHIPDGVQNWTFPSAFTDYSFDYLSVIPEISKALQNKLRMLFYCGDLDMWRTFLASAWLVDSLHDSNPKDYGEWFFTRGDKKINGGFFRSYDHVTFATVRGAGQLVPRERPEAALHIFTNFIQNKPIG